NDLSLQAKGLLSIFLSNSDDWELNMKEIIKRSKNGRDAHYNIVNELIKKGYFARVEVLNDKFQFQNMIYLFSDEQSDIEKAINKLEIEAKEEKENLLIEYKGRIDKNKPKNKTIAFKKDDNENPHTEKQEVDKNPHTENQYTGNRDTENQYINNTKGNNTNNNNTNNEEEEEEEEKEIKNARAKNVVYDITYDFLTDKGIDHKTANKTIKLMINKDIDLCRLKDIKNQFSHMMNKLTHEEVDNHNNFAAYFVNGLEMRTYQSKANKKYRSEQIAEFERIKKAREQRDTSIYFNWLENIE